MRAQPEIRSRSYDWSGAARERSDELISGGWVKTLDKAASLAGAGQRIGVFQELADSYLAHLKPAIMAPF